MNKEKQLNFYPNDEQRKAFDKVVKAMQSAIDKGVVFYGKQWNLVGYTRDAANYQDGDFISCLLYTSPSPRDQRGSRMPSSA